VLRERERERDGGRKESVMMVRERGEVVGSVANIGVGGQDARPGKNFQAKDVRRVLTIWVIFKASPHQIERERERERGGERERRKGERYVYVG
jgi:hypothetical protein